ncbi:MAG: TonB-dependent receptor [Woeseiaceae bacterium]
MKLNRSTTLATAVAIALYANNTPVQAQQTTQQGGGSAGGAMEEIVVTGYRRSIAESLTAKRASNAVADYVSAEDVGKFPDKNLAEAVQRIPGVVINREFGEGERVSIRGTAPNLTRTLYNGHALATADWFILDQLNTTRSFNYLMLPSDIIGKVEVMKSAQANVEEGGIGGTVNVESRNPLDLDKNQFFLNAQTVYNDRAGKNDPYASALASWKNDDGTFGILGALVRQERSVRRDGVEVLGYMPVTVDVGAGPQEVQFPTLIGSALFQQDRIRTGGNVALQFKPSDRLEFNLTGLYSEFSGDNINENFLTWGNRALGNGGTLTNVTVEHDTAVAGTVESLNGGTSDFGAVYDAIQRQAKAQTTDVDLLTNVQFTDSWSGKLRVGHTSAYGNTDNQPFVEFGAPASYDYDLRGSAPQVSFNNIDPTDPADMQFIFSSLHQIKNDDSEDYVYADMKREFTDSSWLDSLEFGVKSTAHTRKLVFNATTYGGFHVPINTTPTSAFAGPLTPNDFLSNVAAAGTLDSYWQIDQKATSQLLFNNLKNTSRILYPQQSFSVDEDTLGGYLMANIASGPWRGNFGVRYVKTDQTSRGNVSSPTGSISNAFGNYDPITAKRTYNDVLPSVNLVYEASDTLQYRFAAGKVMTRPDFTDITPRASLNPGALTGTSGNPDLDPYRANQAEVTVEWYADNRTGASLAVFYKDIQSFITDNPVNEILQITSATQPNASCNQDGSDPTLWNCPFVINERSNGGGGRSYGFEVAGVWTMPNGFGLQGNYTYVDAKADNGDPLPGHSKNQYNLTGFFENESFSARLAYTYRSDFFVTFDRSTHLDQDALSSLDTSLQYHINDNWALTFDGVNLTNEKIQQFADIHDRPRAIYDNGRTYWFGVRMNY